jgi:hypothetical protein
VRVLLHFNTKGHVSERPWLSNLQHFKACFLRCPFPPLCFVRKFPRPSSPPTCKILRRKPLSLSLSLLSYFLVGLAIIVFCPCLPIYLQRFGVPGNSGGQLSPFCFRTSLNLTGPIQRCI